jgi:hypothetical protein|eukprot:COSAG02_NODE_235_length_27784_cov_9.895828_17_plen_99_part_00
MKLKQTDRVDVPSLGGMAVKSRRQQDALVLVAVMLVLSILWATELDSYALCVLQAFVSTLLQCFLAVSPLPAKRNQQDTTAKGRQAQTETDSNRGGQR